MAMGCKVDRLREVTLERNVIPQRTNTVRSGSGQGAGVNGQGHTQGQGAEPGYVAGSGSGVKGQGHNQGKGARSGSGSGTGAWGRAILRDRVQSQSKWQGQVQGAGVKGKDQIHG